MNLCFILILWMVDVMSYKLCCIIMIKHTYIIPVCTLYIDQNNETSSNNNYMYHLNSSFTELGHQLKSQMSFVTLCKTSG